MTIPSTLASSDFASIVQALSDAVVIVGPGNRILFCNEAAETLLGSTQDELVGQLLPIVMPTIFGQGSYIESLHEGSTQIEAQLIGKNHLKSSLRISFRTLQEGTALIMRDITNSKASEMRLIRSQQLGHVGTWERDIATGDLYWSDEMFRICGIEPRPHFTAAEFLAHCVHPEDVEYVQQSIHDANSGTAYDLHYRIVRPGGEVRWVHAQGELDYTETTPVRVIGCIKDVTEYRQSVDELKRSKDNLKLAQKLAKLGHWDWDIITNQIFWSDETYSIIGQDHGEFEGSFEAFLTLVHSDDRDRVISSIRAAISGKELDIEYRVRRVNGEYCVLHVVGQVYCSDTGIPVRLFGTCQDVTHKRRTETMLIRSEKLAVVGKLAAGLAHEIRNPLTALIGFTKLLQDKASIDDKRYLDIISTELQRISGITQDLLALAKPQAIIMKTTAIQSLIRDAITVLTPLAKINDVEFVTDVDGNTPVECEPDQLKQVFINVVKNAIEAMSLGGVLTIQLRHADPIVQIEFADQGPGIPTELISKLGEPFYTTKKGGTGLGLMVSQNIIMAHQGRMRISSEPGTGTIVTIELPIAAEAN